MQPSQPLDRESLASTPSFRKSPDEWPVIEEAFLPLDEAVDPVEVGDDDDGGEEFEFAVLSSTDSFEGFEPISADEIFANGQILPIYPLFNRALVLGDQGHQGRDRGAADGGHREEKPAARVPLGKLMMEDRDAPSTSSSESDDLEGIPADSYCLWAPNSVPPSPDMRRRSHSTGDSSASSSKRWRLRDLVIGRSHSDGRKKFLFLAPPHPSSSADATEKTGRRPSSDGAPLPPHPLAEDEKKAKGKGKGGVRVLEMDMVTAHRVYYAKGGAAAGDRRRSYLPYRKDLVGFFGNVNGAGRSFHQPS